MKYSQIILGANIKRHRKIIRLTQQELADAVGTKRANIGAYEEGRTAPPYAMLIRLCRVFCISSDQLLGIKESEYFVDAGQIDNQPHQLIADTFQKMFKMAKEALEANRKLAINTKQTLDNIKRPPGE